MRPSAASGRVDPGVTCRLRHPAVANVGRVLSTLTPFITGNEPRFIAAQ